MEIEFVNIPVPQLRLIIAEEVDRALLRSKQEESIEEEFLSVKQACKIAGKSRSAIIAWCIKYNIGTNATGSWTISKIKLLKLLKDKR